MPAHDSSFSTARGAELVQNSEGQLIKIPPARIGLSTSSVYPESTSSAFELCAAAGLRRRRDHDRH